jgi:hypothetical protein
MLSQALHFLWFVLISHMFLHISSLFICGLGRRHICSPIDWCLLCIKQQATIARSSIDVEYKALTDTTAELQLLQSLALELDLRFSQYPTL